MPQSNSYRHQFDVELAHQKLTIRPFLELESTSMVMQLLEHSPYLSVLPRYTAKMSIHKGNLAIICGRLSDEPVAAGALSPQQGHHPADPRHARRDLRGREKAVLSRISQKSTGALSRACAFSLYCVITAQNLQKRVQNANRRGIIKGKFQRPRVSRARFDRRDHDMRIVVKVGTSTLAHPTGRLNIQRMEKLCKVLSDLKNMGHEIILVSSGAIAWALASST